MLQCSDLGQDPPDKSLSPGTCREGRRWAMLEERSRFLREWGRWFYRDGQPTITRVKPGRNEPCPCGSPRKFKSCCGAG